MTKHAEPERHADVSETRRRKPAARQRNVGPAQPFDLQTWRRAERRRLIRNRMNLTAAQRSHAAQHIAQFLLRLLNGAGDLTISFYWPFKGEPDLRDLMARLSGEGSVIALPVVVERNRPMIFRSWKPGEALERGAFDIPVPRAGREVSPDVILAPVVGFDDKAYRLGNGGGYFDRTLAGMTLKPIKYGIGYMASRIPTIYPQSHDIPMNAVVTERGVQWPQLSGQSFASPPCSMHELDSRFLGIDDEAVRNRVKLELD